MSSSSYLAFINCARAQLQLLSRDVLSLRCGSAVNRIKHTDFYHQPFSTCLSTDKDGVSKCSHRKNTGAGQSKDLGHDDLPGNNVHDAHIKMTDKHESSDIISRATVNAKKGQNSFFEKTSVQPVRKKSKTATQYLKESYFNYYTSATKHAVENGAKSNLQDDFLVKEKIVRADLRNKSGGAFGNLSLEIDQESKRRDERNPNERIAEKLPEDIDEERDRRLDIPLTRYGRINKKSFYYTRKMSIMGRQGRIKDAIAIFEDWMMVRDRVMPSKRTFVVLIGILGRVGYTKKAFELFGQMKSLGLDPEDHIYTSLFNACANSPCPADGLRRTEYLLNHMREKGVFPNLFTVKAAMKALAISGDFSRVFTLLDKVSTRLTLDIECFNHLLMACISDKEAGFKRALQVWQKIGQYRLQPDTTTFNLLIRSARDCDVGDLKKFGSAFGSDSLDMKIDDASHLLENVLDSFHVANKHSVPSPILLTDNKQSEHVLEVIGNKINIYKSADQQDSGSCSHAVHSDSFTDDFGRCVREQDVTVNTHGSSSTSCGSSVGQTVLVRKLEDSKITSEWWEEGSLDFNNSQTQTALTNHPQSLFSEILTQDADNVLHTTPARQMSLKDLKLPSGRLTLLGGASKFVSCMEAVGAQPDMKTFTQLLACLPNDEQSEFELLRLMEVRAVTPDIDLLNDIMMRRNFRQRSDTVQAVLKVVAHLRLTPNMRTYAAISLTCRKEREAHKLLQDMKEANLEPNSVIMGHLLYASHCNFSYKLNMLKAMESLGLQPNRDNIVLIERSIAETKAKIVEAENKGDKSSYFLSDHFQRSFQYFLRYYQPWLLRTELEKPRHPWDAFKHSPDGQSKKGAQLSATS